MGMSYELCEVIGLFGQFCWRRATAIDVNKLQLARSEPVV